MFYRAFVAPGDLVFDVGANVGVWTRLLLDVGARVVAVEPQPGIFEEPRAVLERVAVGRRSGESELRVTRDPKISGLSTLSAEWPELLTESGRVYDGAWGETIPVRVTTLDELIDRHGVPSYVKVDTEGWDAEVLAGLSHAVQHVSFEFVPEAADVAEAAIGELARLGDYKLSFVAEERWQRGPWPPPTPIWGDVFADLADPR